MRWYSRISLGLNLTVANAFLVAYWWSLDSHNYPNMNVSGLFAYLLVLPACTLLPYSVALASVLQQRKLGNARERALQRAISLVLWVASFHHVLISV